MQIRLRPGTEVETGSKGSGNRVDAKYYDPFTRAILYEPRYARGQVGPMNPHRLPSLLSGQYWPLDEVDWTKQTAVMLADAPLVRKRLLFVEVESRGFPLAAAWSCACSTPFAGRELRVSEDGRPVCPSGECLGWDDVHPAGLGA